MKAEAATSLVFFVPLDKLDLRLVSVVYTRGDYAAVMPNYSYSYLPMLEPADAVSEMGISEVVGSWRDVLKWIAVPGFLISLALLFALPEPRNSKKGAAMPSTASVAGRTVSASSWQGTATMAVDKDEDEPLIPALLKLLRSPAFVTTTMAAALNDVGSYALIAWQSTFYERVYHLEPSVYASMLAAVLPIGGIIGGVGGGWLADKLVPLGLRYEDLF